MNCPFCGVPSDVAHDRQEGCIEALREEILRMRTLLDNVRSVDVPGPVELEDEERGEPAF